MGLSGWGPHRNSGVGVSNHLESRRIPGTQPISKRPLMILRDPTSSTVAWKDGLFAQDVPRRAVTPKGYEVRKISKRGTAVRDDREC